MPVSSSSSLQSLSRVGLGCGVFSGAYGPATQENAIAAVRTAFSSGINLVDTSPYYNDSEIKLGKALLALRPEFPRSSYHICTKLGRYGYHTKDFDYSRERVNASVAESMRRMHTDYLDAVLCHDVEFVSTSEVVDQALPELFALKEKGTVHNVGISGYPLPVLLEIAQIQQQRGNPLDVVLSYCNYNLHCQTLKEYVPKLRAAGVKTIVAASPLSMGLLSSGSTPEWHPAKDEVKNAVAECADLVDSKLLGRYDVTLAEMAEKFAFEFDGVDVHLVGARTSEEVVRALAAYEGTQALKESNDGKYMEQEVQAVYEQVLRILQPFSSYTWPSPPADA
ncbi:hypothetical protein FBU59_004109 [Linderina macrospora]|uniref:Uncharacterized protein n=1 Tax=Linderina macrospora TaxID=4868 RepID=A0ACC1J6L1_9FUNG|nr:hypothetical protein FBU59_004109 [Linderina macrospora]